MSYNDPSRRRTMAVDPSRPRTMPPDPMEPVDDYDDDDDDDELKEYYSSESEHLGPEHVGPFDEGDIHVYNWSQECATALEILAQRYRMILITPDANSVNVPPHPAAISNGASTSVGPFALLRDELTRLHKRVIHVEYTVSEGLHRAARELVGRYPYVIFVIAEPTSPDPAVITRSVAKQRASAARMIDIYRVAHAGTEPDSIVVIYFGTREFEPVPRTPICMKCLPWPESTPNSIVRMLMRDGPMSTDPEVGSDWEDTED